MADERCGLPPVAGEGVGGASSGVCFTPLRTSPSPRKPSKRCSRHARPHNPPPHKNKQTSPQVREVYETAIEAQPPFALSDADTRTLCLRYAHLEQKLGEVDRARAIYVHASALAGLWSWL